MTRLQHRLTHHEPSQFDLILSKGAQIQLDRFCNFKPVLLVHSLACCGSCTSRHYAQLVGFVIEALEELAKSEAAQSPLQKTPAKKEEADEASTENKENDGSKAS